MCICICIGMRFHRLPLHSPQFQFGVSIWFRMRDYVNIYTYIHVYSYVCTYICTCIYVYTYKLVCMHIDLCTSLQTSAAHLTISKWSCHLV